MADNPFSKPTGTNKRLKCFLWGNTGAGKTSLALQFPGVAVIDTENGTEQYSDLYKFERFKCDDPTDMEKALDWLRTEKHSFRTIVIDPITVYWESLQRDWLEKIHRLKRPNEPLPTFQFGDWNYIKSDLKLFLRKLLRLDMNIVVTARAKAEYAEGSFTKIGQTFDGEKSLPYLFDSVLELQREKNVFRAVVHKDRGLRLSDIEWDAPSPRVLYETIEGAYGKENLEKEVVPVSLATMAQVQEIADLFELLEYTPDKIRKGLDKYNAEAVKDLGHEDARKILTTLRKKGKTAKKEVEKRYKPLDENPGELPDYSKEGQKDA